MEVTKDMFARQPPNFLIGGVVESNTAESIGNEKNHVSKVKVAAHNVSKNAYLASRRKRKKTVAKRKKIASRVTKDKRQQTNWEIKEKIKALNILKTSKTKAQVARVMGIPESTLRGWKKYEEKIREQYREQHREQHHMTEEAAAPARPTRVLPTNLIEQYLHAVMQRHMESKSLLTPPPSTIRTKEQLLEWLEEQKPELELNIQAIYLYELHRLQERIEASFADR